MNSAKSKHLVSPKQSLRHKYATQRRNSKTWIWIEKDSHMSTILLVFVPEVILFVPNMF